jgi:hypothetical protein
MISQKNVIPLQRPVIHPMNSIENPGMRRPAPLYQIKGGNTYEIKQFPQKTTVQQRNHHFS